MPSGCYSQRSQRLRQPAVHHSCCWCKKMLQLCLVASTMLLGSNAAQPGSALQLNTISFRSLTCGVGRPTIPSFDSNSGSPPKLRQLGLQLLQQNSATGSGLGNNAAGDSLPQHLPVLHFTCCSSCWVWQQVLAAAGYAAAIALGFACIIAATTCGQWTFMLLLGLGRCCTLCSKHLTSSWPQGQAWTRCHA